MVRTKWCPKQFVNHATAKAVQLKAQTLDTDINNSSFRFPKRIKLKARRKLSEALSSKKLKSPPPASTLGRGSPFRRVSNQTANGTGSRHKRQKSLHKICTNVHVIFLSYII